MGLELKPSKTRLTHTLNKYENEEPGFNFLGFNITPGSRKFLQGITNCLPVQCRESPAILDILAAFGAEVVEV
jgi:hypothetical protein